MRRGVAIATRGKDLMVQDLRDAAPGGPGGKIGRAVSGRVEHQGGSDGGGWLSTRITVVVETPPQDPLPVWAEKGTRPHVIRPRTKKALSFHWPKAGGRVTLAKVNHPGTKPTRWFSNTTKRWAQVLRRAA